jgi:pyrroloquinoline quinone biosynthesis protein B
MGSLIVIGSAAGGGFPQWNCRCSVCALAWAGDKRVIPRTQAGIALSADGERWLLLNASPDLGSQIRATPALHPRGAIRSSPIEAVVLTGAEIDQTAGLLSLRESQPFTLYATATTLATVGTNPMFAALHPDNVRRQPVSLGQKFALPGDIEAEFFPVPGKVPLYLEGAEADRAGNPEVNVGIDLKCARTRIIYVPAAATTPPAVMQRLHRADVLLFDGTLFSDDEMIRTGTGMKSGRRMGHMPIAGEGGALINLAGLAARRIFAHINNTNPILIHGSPERQQIEAAGWEVAEDGMEIGL